MLALTRLERTTTLARQSLMFPRGLESRGYDLWLSTLLLGLDAIDRLCVMRFEGSSVDVWGNSQSGLRVMGEYFEEITAEPQLTGSQLSTIFDIQGFNHPMH